MVNSGEKPRFKTRGRKDPWVGEILSRRKWLCTPLFLPGEFHSQGSLVGFSPWGQKSQT